ncbi:YraN family protein [Patescibacteria group bacterium]|nr:YraN family protein [Patescibacteria group bacterium]MBU4098942.1 YraN family protein [Patescibacteria group bacterium]
MFTNKQISGIKGEDLATSFLRKKGYKIIERNFRAIGGEIDIIALDKDTLVFIEVKARSTKEFGSPLEAITNRKMKSLIKTAQFYKIKNPRLPDCLRIDAVAITLDSENEVKSIELVKNISG